MRNLVLFLVTVLASVSSIIAQESTTACVCPKEGEKANPVCKCELQETTVLPTPGCPQIKCQGVFPPCLVYKRDRNGCMTCECLLRCSKPECPKCARGVEEFFDKNGCPSCRCNQPPGCRDFGECKLNCPSGYQRDRYGCNICQCIKQCVDSCPKIDCPFGRLVDYNGCSLCECKPKPVCGYVCKNLCLYGRVVDENGCPTCQCLPNPECKPICKNICLYGRVVDENGCPTCQCLPNPECKPVCKNLCLYGRVVDDKKCPTCECLPKP